MIAVAHFRYALPVDALRSLAFATLVFDSQAVVYVIRDRRRGRRTRPGALLVGSSLADVALATALCDRARAAEGGGARMDEARGVPRVPPDRDEQRGESRHRNQSSGGCAVSRLRLRAQRSALSA
ncbi:hypothetical protein [Burkholderia humptydooensis]|uniref:hypothetical protein n=1 Tax=Burkholderia humptydooensis TaxID=430531 RepID=UPI001E439634|nr:hypothetical protein [Burkholderia humptydooensis]